MGKISAYARWLAKFYTYIGFARYFQVQVQVQVFKFTLTSTRATIGRPPLFKAFSEALRAFKTASPGRTRPSHARAQTTPPVSRRGGTATEAVSVRYVAIGLSAGLHLARPRWLEREPRPHSP